MKYACAFDKKYKCVDQGEVIFIHISGAHSYMASIKSVVVNLVIVQLTFYFYSFISILKRFSYHFASSYRLKSADDYDHPCRGPLSI